jgi:hypothetical protein
MASRFLQWRLANPVPMQSTRAEAMIKYLVANKLWIHGGEWNEEGGEEEQGKRLGKGCLEEWQKSSAQSGVPSRAFDVPNKIVYKLRVSQMSDRGLAKFAVTSCAALQIISWEVA